MNEALFFEEQRRFVLGEIEKIEYGELTGRQAVQTVSEGSRGTTTVRQYVLDKVGVMKLRANKAEDYNLIDLSGKFVEAPVFFSESGFEYDIEELWAAEQANMNLDSMKAEVTIEAYEEMVNRLIWIGQSDINLTGLANNANVDVATTEAGAALDSFTAQEQVDFFMIGYNDIYTNSKQKVKANTLALSTASYLYLDQTPFAVVAGVTTETLLERILKNSRLTMNDVIVANELETAGAANIVRAIWYDRTPRRVKFNEVLPIEFRPTQMKDNSFKVPTVAKLGGVWIKYPSAFKYLDYEINA